MAKLSRYPKAENRKLFDVWYHMRQRCDKDYGTPDTKNYKERGITYCERWKSWELFCDDMKATYRPGLTLDREDNDKGYSSQNCRWVTRLVQNRNRRNTKWFTINGQTKPFGQWIEESGVKSSCVRTRYYTYLWPIEQALGIEKREG